jgi:hypothetical protein
MPDIKHPDSAEAYFNFLNNEREVLSVSDAVYHAEKGHWEVSHTNVQVLWPKEDDSFEFE